MSQILGPFGYYGITVCRPYKERAHYIKAEILFFNLFESEQNVLTEFNLYTNQMENVIDIV